jgi:histidinol-phosphate aminotransferase
MSSAGFSETHGGISPSELQRLGVSPGQIIDFSVNSNPFGPSPLVLERLRQVSVAHYPDREVSELTGRLAQANGLRPEQVLVGNGTAELIYLVVQALLRPGQRAVIVGPTFGEYRRAVESLGGEVLEIRAHPPLFKPDLDEILEILQAAQPRLAFVCNPNNPTGAYFEPEQIARLTAGCPEGCCLVLDEAYRPFLNGAFFAALPSGRCLALRSMTKEFALAGARLGYVLGAAELINKMRALQPAWSVNAFAQAAGLAVLDDLVYYQRTLAELRQVREAFLAGLLAKGAQVVPGEMHYFLIHLNQPARLFRQRLLQKGFLVRDCTSFGLPEYIRLSTQLLEANEAFLRAAEF